MTKKLLTIVLVIVTIFNVAALATLGYFRFFARPPFPPPFPGDPGMAPYQNVGLDDDQISRLQTARDAFFEKTRPIADSLHQMRMRMFSMLRDETVDTVAVFTLIDSIGSLQNVLQKCAISHIMTEGPILTRDQKQRLFNMFEGYMGKRWGGEHGGRRRGPFGGRRDGQNPGPPDFPGEGMLFLPDDTPMPQVMPARYPAGAAFQPGTGTLNTGYPLLGPGRRDSTCIFTVNGNHYRNSRRY